MAKASAPIVARTPKNGKGSFGEKLLTWYDHHARDLPWRVNPEDRAQGVAPDPYAVWLSEIMLQQTTVATVKDRFETFLSKWPTVTALAEAPTADVLGEWAGLGYYARARNLHACAQIIATEHSGVFPTTEKGLRALPGIGPYTAAAIAAIAFDRPAIVVDGNVDRVIARRLALGVPIRDAKAEIYQHAAHLTPDHRPGDYAQAMMDLGATICRPKSPSCPLCPVGDGCVAFAQGRADQIPVRPGKKARPTRFGHVYVAMDKKGRVLTERRPDKGLFGGMAGLPGTAWGEVMPAPAVPFAGQWKRSASVEHTLTHFHLVVDVWVANVRAVRDGFFWTEDLKTLPTVFRKAVEQAKSARP